MMTMRNAIALLFLSVAFSFGVLGQGVGLSVTEAETRGISIQTLDAENKSAVHVDSTQAVFTDDEDVKVLYNSYVQLLQDLGAFLAANDFEWDVPRRCYNRIYFTPEGTIDYFLFQFLGDVENQPSEEKQKRFEELVNDFIQDYQFGITAPVKFAQCSPTVYRPSTKQ